MKSIYKLKLLADRNIDGCIIKYINKDIGLSINKINNIYKSHPDENICQMGIKESKIILTMNTLHFWNDEKCPLQQTVGIIILDFDTSQVDEAIDAFCRFWVYFAKDYTSCSKDPCPKNKSFGWKNLKARISATSLYLKWISEDNKTRIEEYKVTNGKILMNTKNPKCEKSKCEIRDSCTYYE